MIPDDTITERELITRREAVLRVTALLGGVAILGGSSFVSGCRAERVASDDDFSADDIAFLDEVAETILPETSTPGAKAAKTGAFMATMVRDSYYAPDQKIFRSGFAKIDDATKKAHNVTFMKATPQQRLDVLTAIDREQQSYMKAIEDEQRKRSLAWLSDQQKQGSAGTDAGAATKASDSPTRHYFRMMKELALVGYFTSELGATKAMRYVEAPGRYDPCVPMIPGERIWAEHA